MRFGVFYELQLPKPFPVVKASVARALVNRGQEAS
jgi:hypothetical protein